MRGFNKQWRWVRVFCQPCWWRASHAGVRGHDWEAGFRIREGVPESPAHIAPCLAEVHVCIYRTGWRLNLAGVNYWRPFPFTLRWHARGFITMRARLREIFRRRVRS